MKRTSVLALLLAVSACKKDEAEAAKPVVPAPVTFVSGSRLRATFQEVDGVRMLSSWMDTKLGKPCFFTHGRCLTQATIRASTSTGTFEDDACTSRVLPATGEVDSVLVEDSSSGCAPATLYAASERFKPTKFYVRDAAGACIPAGENSNQADYVRVG